MKKALCLLWLSGCTLLFLPPEVQAEESTAAQRPQGEINISAEDQKVIALMEFLQLMELLQDFEVMTAGEEKK